MLMRLKILIPFGIFADCPDAARIVAETCEGCIGILPHRLDCVTSLVPGILTYESQARGIIYVAVDAGVLVKTGSEVVVSVRRAIGGTDLNQLHESVKREFLTLDERERSVRAAMVKMETGLIGRLADFQHGR
jgi:F-type H+-transporting ATPase subunit epsilon